MFTKKNLSGKSILPEPNSEFTPENRPRALQEKGSSSKHQFSKGKLVNSLLVSGIIALPTQAMQHEGKITPDQSLHYGSFITPCCLFLSFLTRCSKKTLLRTMMEKTLYSSKSIFEHESTRHFVKWIPKHYNDLHFLPARLCFTYQPFLRFPPKMLGWFSEGFFLGSKEKVATA